MSTNISLNKIITFFFGAGFVFLKIQQLPIPILSLAVRILAFVLYFIAYSLWLVRTLLDPDEKVKQDEWYNFTQPKEQFGISALLGMIGCILSVVGVFIPVLLFPAAWFFLIGNTIWTIGEYNKLNNPPTHDYEFSQSHQDAYLSYAILITSMTLITTLVTTLIFFIPALSVPLLICSSLICLGLGMLAWERWIEANFGEHTPNYIVKKSYEQMHYLLAPTPSQVGEHSAKPIEEIQNNSYELLFKNPSKNSGEIVNDSVNSFSPYRDI